MCANICHSVLTVFKVLPKILRRNSNCGDHFYDALVSLLVKKILVFCFFNSLCKKYVVSSPCGGDGSREAAQLSCLGPPPEGASGELRFGKVQEMHHLILFILS